GGDTRQWVIFSVDVPVMRELSGMAARDVEIHSPVIDDPMLVDVLRRLTEQLQCCSGTQTDGLSRLAFEETITVACTLLVSHHDASDSPRGVPTAGMRRVCERLVDDLLNPPSLAELASMTDSSRFQILRRFAREYGMPPH